MSTQLEDPYRTTSSNFLQYIVTYLEILFVLFEWLKILKDPLEEESPIAASEISLILFTYPDSIFLLYSFTYDESSMCLA